MKRILATVLIFVLSVSLSVFLGDVLAFELDSDSDGMPDNWEMTHGLNPSNPNDAWNDPDKDGVNNLCEYLLGTDPKDPKTPKVLKVGRNKYSDFRRIEDALAAAQPGTVIRVAGGNYDTRWRMYEKKSTSVMIQGGWNGKFSVRDPNVYRTVLNKNSSIMNLSVDFFKQAIVLDGVEIRNGSDSYGVISFTSFDSGSVAMFLNCIISGNTATSDFGSVVRVVGFESLWVVNSLIAGNTGTGIFEIGSQVSGKSWVLNSTISENSNHGLRRYEADSKLEIENSIVWGNHVDDIYLEAADASSDFSDIGVVVERWSTLSNYMAGVNDISSDPLFEDPENGNFRLQSGSPCIDAGVRKGVPPSDLTGKKRGKISDVGAYEFQ